MAIGELQQKHASEIKFHFNRKGQAGENTCPVTETNNIITRPRTVLSVQLGIEPPNMAKVEDTRSRLYRW